MLHEYIFITVYFSTIEVNLTIPFTNFVWTLECMVYVIQESPCISTIIHQFHLYMTTKCIFTVSGKMPACFTREQWNRHIQANHFPSLSLCKASLPADYHPDSQMHFTLWFIHVQPIICIKGAHTLTIEKFLMTGYTYYIMNVSL